MPLWLIFVVGAMLFWGSYVPTIHAGQLAFIGKHKGLWAFLFVGLAYFLTAVVVPTGVLLAIKDTAQFTNSKGAGVSLLAGVFGAAGALCVILALINGGKPIYVAPLVFAGAPIVATFVAMVLHRPTQLPHPLFFLGIVLAAAGAALVLRFKPS